MSFLPCHSLSSCTEILLSALQNRSNLYGGGKGGGWKGGAPGGRKPPIGNPPSPRGADERKEKKEKLPHFKWMGAIK